MYVYIFIYIYTHMCVNSFYLTDLKTNTDLRIHNNETTRANGSKFSEAHRILNEKNQNCREKARLGLAPQKPVRRTGFWAHHLVATAHGRQLFCCFCGILVALSRSLAFISSCDTGRIGSRQQLAGGVP